ncbi:sensor histidine kinase [Croceivirga sp. JEA036]|uniref:sensor histidine kinase n=1 Tax=Croceivirga sp. JEA036 TaxID=2721162 RepID=UPI001439F094|nr:ATP-binding protein [Croceivirga sp. JEA036]NJB35003.1 PAS domain S-box protein [Croceivirga sp. JEA036]
MTAAFLKEKAKILGMGIAMLFLVFILFGWILQFDFILRYAGDNYTMKFNTALCFLCLLVALILSQEKAESPFNPIVVVICLFVFSVAFYTLISYYFSFPLEIDNVFAKDYYNTVNPGKMSKGTAICFQLSVIAILLKRHTKNKGPKIAQLLFISIFIIASISIISIILGIPGENRTSFLETMAFSTAFFFLAIAISYLYQERTWGPAALFHGKNLGSKILRRTTPYMILFTLGVSFLHQLLIKNHLLDPQFAIILLTVILLTAAFAFLMISNHFINKTNKSRIKLQKSLENSNSELEQFRHAIDQVAMISVMDNEGVITYANDMLCQVSGYSKEELIGATHSQRLDAHNHNHYFFEQLWATVRSGHIWINEIKNLRKDLTTFWTNAAVIPIKDINGVPKRYLVIKIDITRIKNAEEEILKLNKSLKGKNQELKNMVYIASHDLQEPLRTISSFVNILEDDFSGQFPEEAKTYLDFISACTNRMRNLVGDLMEYAKFNKSLEKSYCDLNQIVDHVLVDLNVKITQSSAFLEIAKLPKVYGNENALRQLFQNLISNALKFRRADQAPKITIECVDRPQDYLFSVKDNGIGIEEKYKEKIFGIFQRLHSSEIYSGTGIGLASCKKIVEIHGGKIWVSSASKQGSTFFFTILKTTT